MLNAEQRDALRRHQPDGRNRLTKAMELMGVTQNDVAAATGFLQPYISRIATGRYVDLPGETMRKFATYFGCAMEELFPAPGEAWARPERRQTPDRRTGGRRRANREHGHPDRRKAPRR